MSQKTIDARAMMYPMPVIAAQKALNQGCTDLTIFVSDIITVESLAQMAGDDMEVGVAQKDGVFAVVIREKTPEEQPEKAGE